MLKERPRLLTLDDCTARGCSCETCGLKPARFFRPVTGCGNPSARLILVGEAPGAQEVSQLVPFVGPSGDLVNQTLDDINAHEPDVAKHITRSDCYVTNAVLCRPHDNRDPTSAEISACNERLRSELLSLPNRKVIVALGNFAIQALWHKKMPAIGKKLYHNEWNAEFGCHVVYAVHPAACLRNPDHFPELYNPLQKAIALLDAPSGEPAVFVPPYIVEDDVQTCINRLCWMIRKLDGILVCDIETAGEQKKEALDYRKGWITQLGFWHPDMHKVYLIPKSLFRDFRVIAHLKRLFSRPGLRLLWHNGKFDAQYLHSLLGFVPRVDEDTLLLHYTLDERTGGKGGANHTLKTLAARYCEADDYGGVDDFTNPEYHAKDCWYTLEVYKKLVELHAQEKNPPPGYHRPLDRYQTVLLPAINSIKRIEMHGVLVDHVYLPELKALQEDWLAQQEVACQNLAGITFPKTKKEKRTALLPIQYGKRGQPLKQRTHTEWVDVTIQEPININSVPQLRYFLYEYLKLPKRKAKKAKGDNPSTEKAVLLEFRDRHPFIAALLEYRTTHQYYTTFTVGAIRESAFDRCIHTEFALSTTVTGRPSSSDLNLQNIPKTIAMRNLYIARPGHWFVEADYSNQEVRIAALLARSTMLRDELTHGDYHLAVAKAAFAKEFSYIETHKQNECALHTMLKTHVAFSGLLSDYSKGLVSADDLPKKMMKELRKFGKAVTFGILYGQKAQGLAERLSVSEEAADSYIRAYLGRFPDLIPWRREQAERIEDPGFVATPFGHYRRFPLVSDFTKAESIRQALNAPIQSCASDGTMLSLVALERELPARNIGYPILFVHDSIEFEIKKPRIRDGVALIRNVMEHAYDDIMRELDFYVPFPVDISIGERWGDMLIETEGQKADEDSWFARHPEYAA